MGHYTVVAPCAFLVDGQAVHHTKPGAVVELDDEQAAELVESGKLRELAATESHYVPPPLTDDVESDGDVESDAEQSSRRRFGKGRSTED